VKRWAYSMTRFRQFLSLLQPEKWKLLLGLLFLSINSAAILFYPQAIRMAIDQSSKESLTPPYAFLALIGLLVAQGITGSLRYFFFTQAGERIVGRLRICLFENLMRRPVSFFDAHSSSDLVGRLASDTAVFERLVSTHLADALRSLITLSGCAVLLLAISPTLFLSLCFLAPIALIGPLYLGPQIRKLAAEKHDCLAHSATIAGDAIANMRMVISFQRESIEIERYKTMIERSITLSDERIRSVSAYLILTALLAAAALASAYFFGAIQIGNNPLSVGEMTSCLLYLCGVGISLAGLSRITVATLAALGAAERVLELSAKTIPDSIGATKVVTKHRPLLGAVVFKDVSFRYPSRPHSEVLHGVNLTLNPGTVTALIGASGAGKSTIVSLLQGFYHPSSGTISVGGEDVRHLDRDWLRSQMGWLGQDPHLMYGTIFENIHTGDPEASEDAVFQAARHANVHEFILSLPNGYTTRIGERGVQLSAGQKQRIAIARVLLKNPAFLILDEATANLDNENERTIRATVQELMRGRTTLVISHQHWTLGHADHVFVLQGGRIAAGEFSSAIENRDFIVTRVN
jgi:ABC-type multidrug transport system fused ATPase/permease subunit